MRCGQTGIKVGDGLSLALQQAVADVKLQRRARLTFRDGLAGIPFAVGGLRPGQKSDEVEPGQLVSRLLTKPARWPVRQVFGSVLRIAQTIRSQNK